MRKKISTTVYITPEQNESLKLLSRKTRVPVAEYIREAIDLLLIKYSRHIPGYQPALPLDQGGGLAFGTELEDGGDRAGSRVSDTGIGEAAEG